MCEPQGFGRRQMSAAGAVSALALQAVACTLSARTTPGQRLTAVRHVMLTIGREAVKRRGCARARHCTGRVPRRCRGPLRLAMRKRL